MNDTISRLMKLIAEGYCCTQIMLILALEAQGRDNADLVRSAGGLCLGIYGSGEVCGALSGGACLISLYAGKGSAKEVVDDRYMMMIVELADRFKTAAENEYGGTRCDEILSKFPDRSICAQIVTDTYGNCMDILVSHGFDPAAGKGG